ncbi:hypothetical protein IV203_011648 [Nitzschia inconspicua]|uniref:Uncharacterized protein n=1 Tax=Nitzschia inconspicua TaxID=303405 RepID=A0A9K3KT57_9STRA|nr:hypothetical protein IV203_011648 [Nitzschia inconspicua]
MPLRFDPTTETYGAIDNGEEDDSRQQQQRPNNHHDETIPLHQTSIQSIDIVTSSTRSYDEEDVDSALSSLYGDDGPDSFHLGTSRVSAANVFTSTRRTPSFERYGGEYQLVPTKLKHNVKLVTDFNLCDSERGRLYLARSSFYVNVNEPKYALTVHQDIFRGIMMEINDAYSTPCGMYFCCHGGDGAHSGVSNNDHVDIKLAWLLTTLVFVALVTIHATLPWPDGVTGFDDDIVS